MRGTTPNLLWLLAIALLAPALAAAAEPPAKVVPSTMPFVPRSAAPESWPSNMLPPVPGRLHLPPAGAGRQPLRAEAAKPRPLRLRPAADRPPLAWDTGLTLPAPVLSPSGPRAYAASPDPALLSKPWQQTGADPDSATALNDPTQEQAHREHLRAIPEMRPNPAALLRLSIPDPDELSRPIRLASPPPDTDAPAWFRESMSRPLLPVKAEGAGQK